MYAAIWEQMGSWCWWCVCVFLTVSVQKLYFCAGIVCVRSLFVCLWVLVRRLCFILPPGVQWSLAILKVRDDTMGEGSVITATSPSPSLHPSIFAFMYSPLSLLWLLVCGLY